MLAAFISDDLYRLAALFSSIALLDLVYLCLSVFS